MIRTTLEDVAERAGVSIKTVSRVLNDEPNVAAKTYKKVKKAMSELNYVPNSAARVLSSGKAMALGLSVGWPVNSPFTSTTIEQTLKECSLQGYNLALFSMESSLAKKVVDAYLGKQVDGIILDTNSADNAELISRLDALNVPYLVIHPNYRDYSKRISYLQIDNTRGARQAMDYLIGIGHRAIGYVSYSSGLTQENDRSIGYRQALAEAGIKERTEWEIEGEATPYNERTGFIFEGAGPPFRLGFDGATHLLNHNKELTAIFAGTDEIAMGVLSAIWHMGLVVPDDISVVGFDDISYISMMSPPLTTVHQPIDEICSLAVRQLIKVIEDPQTEPIDVVFPTHLVIRDSCMPLVPKSGQ